MRSHPERLLVRVPATTANLGPGFDCLGMALDIWNEVGVEAGPSFFRVQGEGAGVLPEGEGNLVYRAMVALFQGVGRPLPPLGITCRNAIPLARGLGSSAAAVVGGLVAANTLLGEPLGAQDLLRLGVALEGHPDNVAPALMGGCRVVVREGDTFITAPVPLPPGVRAVLFVPDRNLFTQEARAVLPRQVPQEDAVFNIGRVGLLVNALATGRWEDLRWGTQDRLHQPYRQALFPALAVILEAALGAGALGAFLSGSGPTVLALARGREVDIGYQMARAAREAGVEGRARITCPVPYGAQVVAG